VAIIMAVRDTQVGAPVGCEPVETQAAAANIRDVLWRASERGIAYLTLFPLCGGLGTRPTDGTSLLGEAIERVLDGELPSIREGGIRIRPLDDANASPNSLSRKIREAERLTRGNQGLTVIMALGYSGRTDILGAVRAVVAARDGIGRIDETHVAAELSTHGMPDPDLIIRTGGDRRLSDFMLWQAAYSELWATPASWASFGPHELDAALAAYSLRDRRFGGRSRTAGARAG
jgi:undecaprenyl diphosphate synthase